MRPNIILIIPCFVVVCPFLEDDIVTEDVLVDGVVRTDDVFIEDVIDDDFDVDVLPDNDETIVNSMKL